MKNNSNKAIYHVLIQVTRAAFSFWSILSPQQCITMLRRESKYKIQIKLPLCFYLVHKIYLLSVNIIWRHNIDSSRLLLIRFSKHNATTLTMTRATKKSAWPMAKRQIGHRKSRSVLSVRFPSSTDVPVLLLDQPWIS